MKRLAIGCGALVGLGVIIAGLMFVGILLNKPKPPEITTLNTDTSIPGGESGGLGLPATPQEQKPVRVTIEATMVELELVPGDDSGRIQIEGNYDKANFELVEETEDKGGYIDYRLKFRNKKSLLAIAWGQGQGHDDISNRLTVRMPRNLLYQLKGQMDMGEFDLDLTGLAVDTIDIEFSKGEMTLRMAEPNQVAMERMQVKGSMGELNIYDIQNYGYAKADFRSSFGELDIRNSGFFKRDVEMAVNMSFGEAQVYLPENSRLDSVTGAMFGGVNSERGEPDESISDIAEVKFRGNIKFGEMRVQRRTHLESFRSVLEREISMNGIEAGIGFYHRMREENPTRYDYGPEGLNSLGYRFLESSRIEEALEIFKLNVSVHPSYANGYDSLAEAYLNAGERELAIANYEKAYAMGMSSSGRRLQRLREGDGE